MARRAAMQVELNISKVKAPRVSGLLPISDGSLNLILDQ